jgi:hypothetical protein
MFDICFDIIIESRTKITVANYDGTISSVPKVETKEVIFLFIIT